MNIEHILQWWGSFVHDVIKWHAENRNPDLLLCDPNLTVAAAVPDARTRYTILGPAVQSSLRNRSGSPSSWIVLVT
jgi:hypothetical protein